MLSGGKIKMIILTGWLVGLFLSGAGADPLPLRVEVRSIYRNPIDDGWGRERNWVFSKKPVSSGREVIEVVSGGEVYCRLFFEQGRLGRVTERLGPSRMRERIFSSPPVLSNGYPVPYDRLSPEKTSREEEVSITGNVGGTGFCRPAKRGLEVLELFEAISKGMVDGRIEALLSPGSLLRMISIEQGENNFIRQLWSEDLNWWIYEETGERKSWLIGYQP